jgi:aspartate/glutamate racemase
MDAIYGKKGIKAGFKTPARQKLNRIADELRHRGARGLVAGCTEIALVADELDTDLPVVNPLRILASVAIQTAGYKEKKSD